MSIVSRLSCTAIMVLGCLLAGAQNLVLNHDFSQLNGCADRRIRSDAAFPPFTGNFADSHNYLDQFNHWFSPPEDGYPSWQNRKSISYVAHHQNCAYAPVDSVIGTPIHLQHCLTYLYDNYVPAPVEGLGYAGLQLMDTVQSQNFAGYYHQFNSVPCTTLILTYASNAFMALDMSRSFLETKLAQSLTAGENYVIEFHTARKSKSFYTTGDIGAYVSLDTLKYFDYRQQIIVPQVLATDSVYNDKTNYQEWTHIKGSFTAQGGEQFLTIGNFKNYNHPGQPHPVFFAPIDTNYNRFTDLRTPDDYFIDAVYLYKSSDSVFAVNLPADTTLCYGDSLTLYASHTNTFKIQASKTFTWSTGQTDSSITIGSPGTYWVEVAYNNRWKQYDTIVMDYYPQYQSGLPADTSICEGSSLNIQVPAMAGISHLWSNGATGTSATLNNEGTWWLQSFTPCDTLTDTIRVSYFPAEDLGLPEDTVLCKGGVVVLQANDIPNAMYTWNNGSSTPQATYAEGGTATLTVYTRCDTLTATTEIEESECEEEEVYIPDSFTPNGDGLNDFFEMVNLPSKSTLHIFNRWGEVLFKASPYQNNWDGTSRGNRPLREGVYIYRIEYKWRNKTVVEHGWVNIMRP